MIPARTFTALEFDKVLDHLANFCLSSSAKTAALALRPYDTATEATEAARLHDECRTWAALAESTGQGSGHDGGKKHFRLTSFPDIASIAPFLRAPHALLDLDALWTLREVLRLAHQASLSIKTLAATSPSGSNAEHTWPRLVALVEASPLPEALTQALRRCLGDDGNIRDESSPELLLVRTELRRLHQSCLRRVKDFANEYNILHYMQDNYMTLASDRYVLPLKANFKGRLQGIIHDWSQTGETCYFEPMFLVEVNNNLQDLKRQEREEERKILEYLTALVREALPLVHNATQLLTRLDLLLALDKLATAMSEKGSEHKRASYNGKAAAKKAAHAAAPATCHYISLMDESMEGGADIYLPEARHPLLALAGNAQPIDLILAQGERGLVISGGNAGGKTVCLKTLGLLVLMGMSGFPVPVAAGARLPAFTHIHAFIGDSQSLEDHVSTFTGQIRQLTHAWEGADTHSLILLDEFGAGTDPAQGAALAQAVLDGLLDKDATVMAATHFPALKTYALTKEKARAASVLFDPSTKRPLFRLAYDQVGASQALDVAREHGLPESILRRAEHYLLMDGEDTSALIERLNVLAVEREKEIDTLKHEQKEQQHKHQKLQERFERERSKLYEEVRTKAGELMHAWKAGKVTHKQALKNMSALRADLAQENSDANNSAQASTAIPVENLRVGALVLHKTFGKKGKICEIDTRKKRVQLDMGGVTLWADMKDLGLGQEGGRAHVEKMPKSSGQGGVLTRTESSGPLLSLDMRGQRADVALGHLGTFLDKAILAGRESVEIVHGRGTGVLRKEVHNFLRTFPGIESFVLAPEDRGGDGMTIVHLR